MDSYECRLDENVRLLDEIQIHIINEIEACENKLNDVIKCWASCSREYLHSNMEEWYVNIFSIDNILIYRKIIFT